MKAVLLRLPFFVVLAVLALHQSHAQPAYPTIESIDATVLNARTIVVGTVTGVVDKSSAEHVREVTFKVAETLKGESVGHLTINVYNSVQELELWKARSARLLVSAPSRTNARAVSIIDLGDEKLLVSKEDFTFLRSPRDLLEYVRQLVRQNPGVYEILVYVLPPPDTGVGAAWQRAMGERRTPGEPSFWGLHVPVNQRLEQTARKMIRSNVLRQRQQGVVALRLFKSEQNTALLKALLKDPGFVIQRTAETNRGLEHRRYPIREAAFRTLAGYWRLPVEQPVMEESVSRIDRIESMTWVEKLADADLWRLRQAKRLRSLVLSNVPLAAGQLAMVCDLTGLTHLHLPPLSVGDARVKQLGGLKHLRSLTLDQNPITDEGLKELAGFTSLKEVSLKETEVTDEGLASLRRSRPDLKVLPANAISAINLYVQNNDLAGVARVLDRTPKVTEEKSRGVTPLQVAAYDCKYEMTKLLLDRGAAVDGLDSEGNSPLTRAAIYYRPNLEVIGLLLARGADVNRVNKSGTSALDLAVDNQNPGLIRLLLACGARNEAAGVHDGVFCPEEEAGVPHRAESRGVRPDCLHPGQNEWALGALVFPNGWPVHRGAAMEPFALGAGFSRAVRPTSGDAQPDWASRTWERSRRARTLHHRLLGRYRRAGRRARHPRCSYSGRRHGAPLDVLQQHGARCHRCSDAVLPRHLPVRVPQGLYGRRVGPQPRIHGILGWSPVQAGRRVRPAVHVRPLRVRSPNRDHGTHGARDHQGPRGRRALGYRTNRCKDRLRPRCKVQGSDATGLHGLCSPGSSRRLWGLQLKKR